MLRTIRDNVLIWACAAFLALVVAGELAPAAIDNLTIASDAMRAATAKGN